MSEPHLHLADTQCFVYYLLFAESVHLWDVRGRVTTSFYLRKISWQLQFWLRRSFGRIALLFDAVNHWYSTLRYYIWNISRSCVNNGGFPCQLLHKEVLRQSISHKYLMRGRCLPYTSKLVKTLLYNVIRQEKPPPPGTHVLPQQSDGGGLLYGLASGVASKSYQNLSVLWCM